MSFSDLGNIEVAYKKVAAQRGLKKAREALNEAQDRKREENVVNEKAVRHLSDNVENICSSIERDFPGEAAALRQISRQWKNIISGHRHV